MSLRRSPPTNRKAEAAQSSLENDDRLRPTTYTSNVETAPSHTLAGRDSVTHPDESESSLTDALGVAENSKAENTNYIYYQIYAEDGAIPSKTPITAGDPFLGRIKARYVPPPRTVTAVKRSIMKVENIRVKGITSLFLTPYSQSPMDDADKVIILNRTIPGSTPQEPLALVAKMSDSERSALVSDGRGGLENAAEHGSTSSEIQYLFYRIYAQDGAIPTKAPVTAGDPFLGRIKAMSIPPPRTVLAVKRSITKVENIKGGESTTLFLTPYSQSPMDDSDKVITLNDTGPGSTPQEPLALVAKMSGSDRSALESEERGGLASAAELDTISPEIQYLYYLLFDDYEMASKVAINPGEPSLGRIRVDSVAPPHSPTSIKRCISRVEGNPALAWYADLFADTSSDTPLPVEDHISFLRTDGPGLSPNEPMAFVFAPPIADGKYLIKNRAEDIYWNAWFHFFRVDPIRKVHFWQSNSMKSAKEWNSNQWDITHDADGNISMMAFPYDPSESSWVGADMTESTVPFPWRLIPAEGKFYYLTTDMNHFNQNPSVPTVKLQELKRNGTGVPRTMAYLMEGNERQMWEFIRI